MNNQNGLTDAVLDEIVVSLNSNEIIKSRIRAKAVKNERNNLCSKIQQKINAEILHQIGFIKIFYRSKPEK